MDDNEPLASERGEPGADHGYSEGFKRWHGRRVKPEDRRANTASANITDVVPGCVRCPSCGMQFFPFCLYTVYQVAASLMVTVARVRQFMAMKDNPLRYRLWARSSRVLSRVVDSRDLDNWLHTARPYPGNAVETHAAKLYEVMTAGASKGGRTTRARRLAKEALSQDQISDPSDPGSPNQTKSDPISDPISESNVPSCNPKE